MAAIHCSLPGAFVTAADRAMNPASPHCKFSIPFEKLRLIRCKGNGRPEAAPKANPLYVNPEADPNLRLQGLAYVPSSGATSDVVTSGGDY